MKYDLTRIMKRAWEIKDATDRNTKKTIMNMIGYRELRAEEKAPFGECLKISWAEAKRVEEIADEYQVTTKEAEKMAAKETDLETEAAGNVYWNIWTGGNKKRAYYKCSRWCKHQNSKYTNFVSLN